MSDPLTSAAFLPLVGREITLVLDPGRVVSMTVENVVEYRQELEDGERCPFCVHLSADPGLDFVDGQCMVGGEGLEPHRLYVNRVIGRRRSRPSYQIAFS